MYFRSIVFSICLLTIAWDICVPRYMHLKYFMLKYAEYNNKTTQMHTALLLSDHSTCCTCHIYLLHIFFLCCIVVQKFKVSELHADPKGNEMELFVPCFCFFSYTCWVSFVSLHCAAIISNDELMISEQESMFDNLNVGHPELPDEEGDERIIAFVWLRMCFGCILFFSFILGFQCFLLLFF